MIKKIMMLAAVAAVVSLSGCATIFSGSTQPLAVKAVNSSTNQVISDAACTVEQSADNQRYPVSTPGSVTIQRGKGTLNVVCTKPGYKTAKKSVFETVNGVTFVNILFWPGLIVDYATGAMQKYPETTTVSMSKS